MVRKLYGFDYYAPVSLEEAASLLSRLGSSARILAGGTDLLVEMKYEQLEAEHLVDIKGIPGLSEIRYEAAEGLRLGALATIREVETSPEVRGRFPIVAYAASKLGSVQVRNRATVGGNLCHAAPSAELAPSLIALKAQARIFSSGSTRNVPLEQFFSGPGQTVLRAGEILTEILVPNHSAGISGCYLKHSVRRAMDIAIVGVAVALYRDGGICEDARIVLGAVAPTPMRAKKAEEVYRGRRVEEALMAEASRLAAEESSPISDLRASAEYRREIVRVLVGRATREALGLAKYS